MQGSLDYTLSGLVYARDTASNEIQHRLSAALNAEAVEDHLYVDLRGSVARQPISALGPLSADPSTASSNYSARQDLHGGASPSRYPWRRG